MVYDFKDWSLLLMLFRRWFWPYGTIYTMWRAKIMKKIERKCSVPRKRQSWRGNDRTGCVCHGSKASTFQFKSVCVLPLAVAPAQLRLSRAKRTNKVGLQATASTSETDSVHHLISLVQCSVLGNLVRVLEYRCWSNSRPCANMCLCSKSRRGSDLIQHSKHPFNQMPRH